MGFDDRLSLFMLGCLIGSVVGYIVRLLQESREKLNEVDEHVKDAHHAPRDEKGFMRYRVVADVMMLIVLVITSWAAFSTQKVNNDLKSTQADLAETQGDLESAQARMAGIVLCTSQTLGEALVALNERTTYSGARTQANVELQKMQADMLRILLHEPPYPEAAQEEAADQYFEALIRFLDLSEKQKGTTLKYDYPSVDGFEACLDNPQEG